LTFQRRLSQLIQFPQAETKIKEEFTKFIHATPFFFIPGEGYSGDGALTNPICGWLIVPYASFEELLRNALWDKKYFFICYKLLKGIFKFTNILS